jgi:hypothetical protein
MCNVAHWAEGEIAMTILRRRSYRVFCSTRSKQALAGIQTAANMLSMSLNQMFQTQSAKPSRGSHRRRDNRLQNSALAKFRSLSLLLRAPFKRNDSNGMLNCVHTAASSSTQYPSRL